MTRLPAPGAAGDGAAGDPQTGPCSPMKQGLPPGAGTHLRHVVFALCAYECAALYTGLPTLTVLASRHRLLAPVLLGGLAVHLYRTCGKRRETA
jgi:hypothetical protein